MLGNWVDVTASIPKFKNIQFFRRSGKTYTLTKEYLTACPENQQPLPTFGASWPLPLPRCRQPRWRTHSASTTNFADDTTCPESERVQSDLLMATGTKKCVKSTRLARSPEEALRERAALTIPENHSEYGDFPFCTIDSFVNRLVSAFTEDLNIPFTTKWIWNPNLAHRRRRPLSTKAAAKNTSAFRSMEAYRWKSRRRKLEPAARRTGGLRRNLLNEQVFARWQR